MDNTELINWEVLEYIDPWGQRRDDLRTAKMVADIANMFVKAGSTGYTAFDYVMDFEEKKPARPQTPEEMERIALMYVAAHNAAANRKKQQIENIKKIG